MENIRETEIATAINFLNNPKVQRSPLSQKQSFLRAKGMTEDEIQVACERAGAFSKAPQQYHSINIGNSQIQEMSRFAKIKEYFGSIAMISSIAWGLYLLYKKLIEPLLFGRKKKKSIEDKLDEINKTMKNNSKSLKNELVTLREEFNNTKQESKSNAKITKDLEAFKADLESIKGLLLNRKQFASPLPVITASIPSWQLQASQPQLSPNDEDNKLDDSPASSETEVVTKNSDSSIEMM